MKTQTNETMKTLEKNLAKINNQEVESFMMEALKGSGYYNNELDATMNNPHFKSATLGLIVRNVKITRYTDGKNELFFCGEGANIRQWTGLSILSK